MKRPLQIHSLFFAATLSLTCLTDAVAGVDVGDAFPKFSSFGLEGRLPNTAGKVVLVDVFASWCKPCKKAFPVLDELVQSYSSRGLVVVAVSVDENRKQYEKFVAKLKPKFHTARDAQHRFANVVSPPGMPSSYLIDKKGRVRYLHRGFKGAKTRAAYIKEVEALLRE